MKTRTLIGLTVAAIAGSLIVVPARAQPQTVSLISTGAVWRYLDTGVDQGTPWRQASFDDSAWRSGPAQLGYGDGDEATVVSFGPNPASRYITTYFRRAFSVNDPSLLGNLTVGLLRDDGGVVYVNGVEVFRSNMPTGTIAFATLASAAIGGAGETTYFQTNVPSSLLVAGANVVAVEIHQSTPGSADLSFDLFLNGLLIGCPPPTITCPTNRIVECATPAGTAVTFSVSASSTCANPVSTTCSPPSGSTFPFGTTTVICRAVDSQSRTSTCNFTVTVRDTTPPSIFCPTNVTATADGPEGASVVFNVTATDNCASNVAIVCTPPSGSVFALGTTPVNCVADDGHGNTRSCSFNVTVQLPTPVIESVSPLTVSQGDVISVRGSGFGDDPNNLCVVGKTGTRLIPMRVRTATDTEITVEVGPVPPDGATGMLGLSRGAGAEGPFQPTKRELDVREQAWVFMTTQGGTMGTQLIRFVPAPAPDPQVTWYHSDPAANGVVCITLPSPCPPNTKLQIDGHFDIVGAMNGVRHVDLWLPSIFWLPGGTPLDLADAVCDAVATAFFQQFGVQLDCSAVAILNDGAKITFSYPGGSIQAGGLTVCTSPAEPPQPVIIDVTPLTAMEGDILTITGEGFGNNPNDICAVVINPGKLLPLRVLTATDTEVRAQVGTVPPDALPGQVGLVRGVGREGLFRPGPIMFGETEPSQPNWAFAARAGGVMSQQIVTLLPPQPDPTVRFHSTPVADCALCIVVDQNWPPNSRVTVDWHFNLCNTGNGITHLDRFLPGVVFETGGSALDCLTRICEEILDEGFRQANLICEVTDQGNGVAKLRVVAADPNACIKAGGVNIVLAPAQRLGAEPQANSATPNAPMQGGMVTINGTGLGTEPDALCVVVKNGNRLIPMRALTANNNQMTALLGAVPPGATPGPVGLVRGFFRRGTFVAGFNDLAVGDGGWFFVSPQVGVMTPGNITPVPVPPPNALTRWYHSLPPSNGMVCLYLSNACPRNTKLEIDGHFNIANASNGVRHIDVWMPPIIYKPGGSALGCLQRVCDALVCAFKQKFGVTLSCRAIPVPGGAKLVITYPGGTITAGGLTVCVTPGPGPRIDLAAPLSVEPGEILTIQGANFGNNPDDVCAVLDDGNGRLIGLNVLSARDDEIRAELPPIPMFASGKPHRLKVVIGQGQRPRIVPDFDDVLVEENPWTWVGAPQGAAVALLPIIPRFVLPENPCLHSTPPSNGVIAIVIDRDWGQGQTVCIGARIHKPSDNGSDINFAGVTFSGGGTRFDCAVRICDLLKKAFAARGRAINCNVTSAGANAVIRMSCADAEPLNAGYISICFKPPRPLVQEVFPSTVFPDTILTIQGRNFGIDPDDLCVALENNGRLIGLEVMNVQDDQIQARVGFVPAFAADQPHRLMVGRGAGARPLIVPEFDDVHVEANPWIWVGPPWNMGVAQQFLVPRFRPDPVPGFHSTPPSNGVICVVIDQDWGSNTVVCIGARIHKPSDNGHDINFSDVTFTGSGTRFDCAVRICSLLKQAFMARGRLINCNVTAVGDDAKITMSCSGAEPLNEGYIDIRIKSPPLPPIIRDIFPLEGGEGDIVTVFGQGFGDVPGDICMVQRFGDRANPMEVLSVADDMITARLGFVPEDADAGEIMIARGRGIFGRFTPIFDDVIANDDVWVWQGFRPGAVAVVPFRPRPSPPPGPGVQWFFERLVNGRLETIIKGSWAPGTFVWVQARAHSATRKLDLSAPRCRFVGSGTALQCAMRMKDIIQCAFKQQAGVNVVIQLEDLGNDCVKIIVSLPPKRDGSPDPIVWGLLRICVTRETLNLPMITGVTPASGRQGALITIRGVNLPSDPARTCDLVVQPNGFIPLEAISASPTQIVARLGPVPPGPVPGRIMDAIGVGGFGPFVPRFSDIVPLEPVWVLRRTTEPAATSPANFTPIFTQPPAGTTYYYGFVSNGVLCIFLTSPWPTNAIVDIWGGIDDTNRPVHGELRAPQLRFTQGGSIEDCAQRLADCLLCPFVQRTGLSLQKDVTVIPGTGVAKLTIKLRGGYIHKGFLTVCVRAPRPRPTITSVTPAIVDAGGILTINGTGFGTESNNVCAVIRDAGIVVAMRAISTTDTQIRAVVGDVPPGFGSGVVMVGIGEGSEGSFTPAFDDMVVAEPAWTLVSTDTAAVSTAQVTPRPRTPPPGVTWWFSQSPSNGMIMLIIDRGFQTPVKFQVRGRFQLSGSVKDIDVDVPCFIWNGSGSALDAARRLCDGPVCALFQRIGVRIRCTVVDLGNNTAKITVSYDGGPIIAGSLSVCATPAPLIVEPVITAVFPNMAGEGEVVTIIGRNFGNDPNNLCVVARAGNTAVPLRAFSASETQILARVGIAATDIGPTRIMVGIGQGNVGRFQPAFPDIIVEDDAWVWRGFDQGALAPGQFVAVPSAPRFGVQWYEGQVVDGRLCTYIRGNWASNTLVQITARAHTQTEKLDLEAPRTRFLGAGTTLQCALRMKDIIQCAFRQQAGANVNVDVDELADGRVKITVSRADGQPIVWGLLTICVSKPVTFPEEFPVHMNVNISQPCKPGPGNIQISKMTDTAGNMVELRCVNGMYLLYFIKADGTSKIIGKCIYPWGENAGWKFLDANGRFQKVVWYNYEGHHGHNNNNPIHDTNGDGRENRDCYIYDVATGTLTVRKDDRGLNPSPQWLGQANPALEWEIQRVSNPRPAPDTVPGLDLLFADLVGPALPDGDYDAQMPALQFFGTIRGGGQVVLSVNHYPVIVETVAGMTAAQLARQVADQFNQRWQQDQTQQGQQRQQQGKTATNDTRYPHIVDFRNALQEELQVTILGESNLFFNEFSYPDQSVRRQRSPFRHKNVSIAEPCLPVPGNKQISIMTDNAGNSVELRCENGSYHLYFIRPDGTRTVIGQCIYLWGENAGWKNFDAHGNFTVITWYNYEGHHGHNNNECVHDSGHNPGKENRDCYIYDVATDRMKIRKECRPLKNCRSDPTKPWQMIGMTEWRRGPRTLAELHELFSDVVDADLPNGDYDAQTSSVQFLGSVRGGGRVVVTINDFPIVVPTVSNMSLAQVASQVSQQFNQQWQQGQTQQGQQQQQQGKSATIDTQFPFIVDLRNALTEEIHVAIIDEPDLDWDPNSTPAGCGDSLMIRRDGDSVVITWEGDGVLQCITSLNLLPNWTTVANNPTSPYTTSAAGAAKFYRVCCP